MDIFAESVTKCGSDYLVTQAWLWASSVCRLLFNCKSLSFLFCSAFQSYQLPLYRSVRTWARFKPSTNFRQKEKEILDQVLDYSIYDYRIRPGGLVNDTSKCTFPFSIFTLSCDQNKTAVFTLPTGILIQQPCLIELAIRIIS